MTEKKEKILYAAQKLFALEGYQGTSTAKVAKEAGVSEALIFRHFGNKEGLLKAILALGEERAMKFFSKILMETDPLKVINNALELPFQVAKKEMEFWKLQFAIKWQVPDMESNRMEPFKLSLSNAFNKLGYSDPENEAELLLFIIEGLSSAIIKTGFEGPKNSLKFLKRKYNITK